MGRMKLHGEPHMVLPSPWWFACYHPERPPDEFTHYMTNCYRCMFKASLSFPDDGSREWFWERWREAKSA